MINAVVESSPIHGFGVFATEPVPKGTVTWRERDAVDHIVSADFLLSLPPMTRRFIYDHCYRLAGDKFYRHCTDGAQWMNHSPEANCAYFPDERLDRAVRDIAAGEEVTTNYWLYNVKYAPGVMPLRLIEPMPSDAPDAYIKTLIADATFHATAVNGKYKDAPHQYALPLKCEKARALSVALKERLRWNSYPGTFNGWPYDYTNVDCFKYWFCGTVINREVIP